MKILVGNLFPLNNSEILGDIFAKLGTNIQNNQAIYKHVFDDISYSVS